jgi:hypothetical protein
MVQLPAAFTVPSGQGTSKTNLSRAAAGAPVPGVLPPVSVDPAASVVVPPWPDEPPLADDPPLADPPSPDDPPLLPDDPPLLLPEDPPLDPLLPPDADPFDPPEADEPPVPTDPPVEPEDPPVDDELSLATGVQPKPTLSARGKIKGRSKRFCIVCASFATGSKEFEDDGGWAEPVLEVAVKRVSGEGANVTRRFPFVSPISSGDHSERAFRPRRVAMKSRMYRFSPFA